MCSRKKRNETTQCYSLSQLIRWWMSRSKPSYCSCPTCTQIRNEQPKHYRYLHSIRDFLQCCSCLPRRRVILEKSRSPIRYNSRLSTITFREIDVTNKHCSKHDVMIKASRPHLSKLQSEELRQRVKEANLRWTRMSILPASLVEFIFHQKDFLPLCHVCYENLSNLVFNLCHRCIRTVLHSGPQLESMLASISTVQEETQILSLQSDSTTIDETDHDESETMKQLFLDFSQGESVTWSTL